MTVSLSDAAVDSAETQIAVLLLHSKTFHTTFNQLSGQLRMTPGCSEHHGICMQAGGLLDQ